MSRPAPSAPSHIRKPAEPVSPGASRASITVTLARSYGFCGESSGANSASATITISAANEPVATGLAKNSRARRRNGVSAPGRDGEILDLRAQGSHSNRGQAAIR